MKLKHPLKALMLGVAALLATPTYAASNHGYAVDYIQGEGDVKGLKLAYQYHIPNESCPFNTPVCTSSLVLIFGSMAKTINIKRISC